MAKLIAVCGKICSGKTYYANQLKAKENAVILSCDELTKELFDNDLGDKHDEMAARIWSYFKKKAAELVQAGCTVIFDWGFWSRANRESLNQFCREKYISVEWHYVDVDDKTWERNIEERNARVLAGKGEDSYYLDEGLKNKLLSMWQEPTQDEIDVWHKMTRQ